MNSLTLGRFALNACVAATLLVGCGGLQPAGINPGPAPQGQLPEARSAARVIGLRQSPRSVHHASVVETVMYSFGASDTDGVSPESGLTYLHGTFYGTTDYGGGYQCGAHSCGTVYSITPSRTEKILHSFSGKKDGDFPSGDLTTLNGTLYGTTGWGGGCAQNAPFGCGTVFSITLSGHETVLHAFAGSPDGWDPLARLLYVNGTMYGTTQEGGMGIHGGDGTAFTITPSGVEKVIHTFHKDKGTHPAFGALVDLNGKLYGTASEGGAYGQGGVFSLSNSGREKILHSFQEKTRSAEGSFPLGGLVAIKRTLYGTTLLGGTVNKGTVFSITPSGDEKVLHSFMGGNDGAQPVATLLVVNGTLYGTTSGDGSSSYGTVFSITPSGSETVLHNFTGGQDGAEPYSDLVYVNGRLYGTTLAGGEYNSGTVFSITP
jgi:uncharacterized repeat protein (TIGR03803 family)